MRKQFTTISPIDSNALYTKEFSSIEDIDVIIKKSQVAYESWSCTNLKYRQDIIDKFNKEILNQKEALASELTKMMGRPIRYTQGEITTLVARSEYMQNISNQILSPIVVEDNSNFKKYIKRVPLGPILLIAPWNYPYITAINGIIPALLAGNTVILKHSPQTPMVSENFKTIFDNVGLPKDVFQFIHIDNDDVPYAVHHPLIKFVNFTGSVDNGKKVQNAARDKFMAVGLELGGKDPAYVREDADIGYTAEQLVDGAMFNSGQSCCSVERIYVHHSIYDRFVDKFVEITKGYVLDDPLDPNTTLGPMVSKHSAQFVRKQIKEAVSQGAKALIEESLFPNAKNDTNYVAPQVLIDVNHNMSIMKDESFGPVVGIMKVNSDEEAINLMNDSEFGLTASIWTNDIDKCTYIGDLLETGTVFMNRCDFPDPALAWTGVKNSGKGCTLSSIGFEALTRPKSYHLKYKI